MKDMGRSLTLPWHSLQHLPDHSQDYSQNDYSSSNPTLTPQSSLQSIPSLTHNSHIPESAAAQFRCLATLKGHSSYIFSLALSGKHIYSGASDGEIRVWGRSPDSADFDYAVVAEGYSAAKSMVVLGDKLITAHHDHKIRVWKIDSDSAANYHKYRMIATVPTLNDRCLRVFSPKNYVQIRRHNRRTWVHHVDTVSCLALSGDGGLLYSVSWDRTIKVWRTSDFKCVESVQNAHDDAINAVVLSNDDDGCVYTCSADKTIKVWARRGGDSHRRKLSLVSTLEKHKSAVNALALGGDGSVLYSGACDRSIIVWECDGGGAAAVGALRGHKKAILCLAAVSDLVCSGSADGTVRIWRGGSGSGKKYSCLSVLTGHRSPVKCLMAAALDSGKRTNGESRNSYMVYSGSLDFDVRVWLIGVPF
ncbi:protein JINGUBANG-like [Andrographis paniculata]|uniref:protein JINGUBANG-like n=1 Tax=Andrographis paniculata TaxID=175694 RepID=UPI0021E76018|nr:protein JINGUBANG-like [Andrographis paniculata]